MDRAAEQPGVLQHHAEQVAQVAARHVVGVDAVDQDAAVVDLVEAQEEVDEGRLAGAGGTDDGHGLAGLHVEREIVDERRVGQVAERHVFERDVAARVLENDRRDRVGLLLGLVEQLEDALGRGRRALQHVHDAGHLRDRHGELARVLDEGRARRRARCVPLATLRPPTTAIGHVVEVAHEVHHRQDDAGDELRLEARLVELLVLLVEGGDRFVLAAEDLDHVVAREHLLDVAAEVAGVLPLRRELLLRELGDEEREHERERHGEQRDQRPAAG